jgi:hypothetical protein
VSHNSLSLSRFGILILAWILLPKSGGLGGEWEVCQKRTFSTQLL